MGSDTLAVSSVLLDVQVFTMTLNRDTVLRVSLPVFCSSLEYSHENPSLPFSSLYASTFPWRACKSLAVRIEFTHRPLSCIRAMLAGWLPLSYALSQCTILALGFWAIVHHESAVQIELVCRRLSIFSTARISLQMMIIKTLSIILDSVAIGMYFQIGRQGESRG